MPRKSKPRRGTHRMASPAQMERLRAVLGTQLPQPLLFETYRQVLRLHLNPESNPETQERAWEHLERPGREVCARLLAPISKALHAYQRHVTRGTGGVIQ